MKYSRLFIVISLLFTFYSLSLSAQDNQQVTHIVQPGENLFRIALRYGIDLQQLSAANGISDARSIYSGQELIIPGLTLPAVAGETTTENSIVENPLVAASPIIHVIQRGEILTQIAGQYGVTIEAVMQANGLADPNRIRVGDELQIWASPEFLEQQEIIEAALAAADEAENNPADTSTETTTSATDSGIIPVPAEERVEYVVQAGEYLSQIATRFGVSWPALAEVNNITNPDTVFAGMKLLIPNGSDILSESVSYATYSTARPTATEPGARIGIGREIVVVLSTQMVYAYEDSVLQHSALASTGLPGTPTVQGDYKVWNKTRSQTMTGPGYALDNVEWVMYFYQGYGLHGTWWHNNFGQPMSHGCVNLTNDDAKWFYDFGSVGTPVHVRFY